MRVSSGKNLLLGVLLLSGCSGFPVTTQEEEGPGKGTATPEPVPEVAPLPEPSSAPGRAPAVVALLEMARDDRAQGRDEQAAVRIERALRIAPRDPELWLALAHIYYDGGDFKSAAQFADKARRLSGFDEGLKKQADALWSEARRQGG